MVKSKESYTPEEVATIVSAYKGFYEKVFCDRKPIDLKIHKSGLDSYFELIPENVLRLIDPMKDMEYQISIALDLKQ